MNMVKKVDLMGVKDRNAFSDALKTTKQGDTIRYHTGYCAGGLFKHDALMAAEARLVNLVQKKLGAGLFQYMAQRTKKKFKK
tara:strand:+ start:243 stop:488 length:246 start_codon:yes stop_codon:yes gene_type:complete